MSELWQKPLIRSSKQDIQQILDEVEQIDDLDLWNEVRAKLTDVIVVYRRSQQRSPTHFTFSDGVTRDLTEMAYAHAVAEEYPGLDADDEFPAWMGRGEGGA